MLFLKINEIFEAACDEIGITDEMEPRQSEVACAGSGKINGITCRKCKGRGQINKRLIGWIPIEVKSELTMVPDGKFGYEVVTIYGSRELEIATGNLKGIVKDTVTLFKNENIPAELLQSDENPDGLRSEDEHD